MNKLKITKLLMVAMVTILAVGFTVGCGSDKKDADKDSTKVEDSVNKDKDENKEEEKNQEDSKEEDITESSVKQDVEIYTEDVNTGEETVVATLEIESGSKLEDKVTEVANAISKDVFSGLPIELLEIKKDGDSNIAIINLKESEINASKTDVTDYEGISWATGYFQGSAGGSITTNSLLKTFLQSTNSDLKNWIDGVQFLYNGELITFEHVEKLSEVQMRQ